jgi:glycosyltransferase involved in cell wall biosynthesis
MPGGSGLKRTLKRLARRCVPDAIMARYRLIQHSRSVRTNLVLFIDDRRLARKWVNRTPDTVQVRTTRSGPSPRSNIVELGKAGLGLGQYLEPGVDAVVAGQLQPPRLVGGRRVLPNVSPVAMAVPGSVLTTVGVDTDSSTPHLVDLYRRLMDAGFAVGVVPTEGQGISDPPPIARGSMVMISGVPLHDVGGGSRTAQLALELAVEGFHVTFLSVFPAMESVDLGLRFLHPFLEQYWIEDFDIDGHLNRITSPRLCLVALPSRAAVESALALRNGGYRIVYDLIDDWSDPALGAEWFDHSLEDRLIAGADLLTASAPDLVRYLETRRRPVELIPNAVNAELFGRRPGSIPADLPSNGGPILGYHGSLYGSWFDWVALVRLAQAFPDARVVVIGDVPGAVPAVPGNVTFLGLKPQVSLPDYVGRFDVGIIPFVLSETTHAVSPLKAFEYLAMGVPVAAPPLRALAGLDGVFTSPDLVEAVRLALAGPAPDPAVALAEHSWTRRAAVLLDAAGISLPEVPGPPVEVVIRPPIHHPPAARLL